MPRTSRASRGGFVYHVLNRGNGRCDVFHKDDDFAAFVNSMREAHEKSPMRLAGFCLMTNHFHLLPMAAWRRRSKSLDAMAHDISRTELSSSRQSQRTWLAGSLYALPVRSHRQYLTVLRYVERKPLRAKTVERSQDWEWSSLKQATRSGPDGWLRDGPILKPAQWTRHVKGANTGRTQVAVS